MTDKHLDDAIDRAVREMMSVDADPAFRARVFQRLERSSPFRWHRLTIAGAALAAVVLGIVLTRTPPAGPVAPEVAATRPQPVEAPAPRPAPSGAASQVASREASDAPTPRRRERPGTAAATNVTQTVRAGALVATVADSQPDAGAEALPDESRDGIHIAPLEMPSIAPAPIVIAPLPALTELRIAPLSLQGPRN